MAPPLLSVAELGVAFGDQAVLEDLSFNLDRGETLGLVGESGSGKSVTALTILRLLDPRRARVRGAVRLDGMELLGMPEADLRRLRGRRIAMVFQDPMTSLNPSHTVGEQITEALRLQRPLGRAQARKEAQAWLSQVGVPDPASRLDAYPHELSGGLRQRVVIAMALCGDPDLLIADEPTTALDATVQAQVMDLICTQQARRGMALLFISHDLDLVAKACRRILVLYAGHAMEEGPADRLLPAPRHPYTLGLLESARLGSTPKEPLREIPGHVPDARHLPAGCRFHTRCFKAGERCGRACPPVTTDGGRSWRCHLPLAEAP